MFCTECGGRFGDQARFCPHCGAEQTALPTTPPGFRPVSQPVTHRTATRPVKQKGSFGRGLLRGVVLFVVIIGGTILGLVVLASQSSTPTPSQGFTPTPPSQSAPAAPTPKQTADPYGGKPGDKDFAVVELLPKDDGLGDIGGIIRVKNVGSTQLSALFEITFFKNGRTLGTAEGSAEAVAPGQTVTVDLVSQTPIFSGAYRYSFQVSSEF